MALVAAVPGIVLTVLYFSGYQRTAQHPAANELEAVFRTSLQFISLMFGTEAAAFWPGSALAALTVIALSVLILVATVIRPSSRERPRALGLLCVFGALACLTLAVGWGRAGSGEQAGFEPRYVTLVAPVWLAVIFTWEIFMSPVIRRVALTSLLATAFILLWPFTSTAIEAGRKLDRQAEQFLTDIKDGAPLHVLIKRHTRSFHSSQDVLADKFARLRKRGSVCSARSAAIPFSARQDCRLTRPTSRWRDGKTERPISPRSTRRCTTFFPTRSRFAESASSIRT